MLDHPVARVTAEITVFGTVLGSFVGYLPQIAAGLGAIWYCVVLYDRFSGRGK